MCLGEEINKVRRETGTEALAERAAIPLLRFYEVFVHFADRPLKGSSIDSRFQLCWKSVLKLHRRS